MFNEEMFVQECDATMLNSIPSVWLKKYLPIIIVLIVTNEKYLMAALFSSIHCFMHEKGLRQIHTRPDFILQNSEKIK